MVADTPQFFPSAVAIIPLLEKLLRFVIALASDDIVDWVEAFHRRHHQLGPTNINLMNPAPTPQRSQNVKYHTDFAVFESEKAGLSARNGSLLSVP